MKPYCPVIFRPSKCKAIGVPLLLIKTAIKPALDLAYKLDTRDNVKTSAAYDKALALI